MECSARINLPKAPPAALEAPPAWEAQRAALDDASRRALEETGLAWRGEFEGKVSEIIETARRLQEGGLSLVEFVVGEWGLGKTFTGDLIVEEARRAGFAAARVPYDNILDAARRALEGSPSPLAARAAIERYLLDIGSPALVVVDEVESAIRTLRGAASRVDAAANNAFFEVGKGLLNPELEAARSLRGRVHLVLLLTWEAYRLLLEMLRAQGVAGKFLRRVGPLILRPLTKPETVRLLEAYTRILLGVEAREVLSDPRLLEVFYTISQGNPGAALQLYRQVLLPSVYRCGGRCICRIGPRELLDLMASASVTGEEGVAVSPLNEAVAAAALPLLGGRPRALLLAASTSVLLPGEYDSRDLDALSGARLRPTITRFAWLGGELDVAEWLSTLLRRFCPSSSSECETAVERAVSWLVHLGPDGRYLIALPESAREARNWLEQLGWPPDRLPDDPHASLSPRGARWVSGALCLAPESVMRLYRVRATAGLEYVVDPRAREEAKQLLEEAQHEPQRFGELVAKGISKVLVSKVREVTWSGEGLVYRYTRESTIGGTVEPVAYHVPVRVEPQGLYDARGAVASCRKSPELQAAITLLPVPEDSQPNTSGCPGIVALHLPQGLQRSLAALGAALETAAEESIDRDLLDRELKRLAEILDLEARLREGAERLYEASIIVEPYSPGVLKALKAPGVKDAETAALFLADAHRYLVAAGGTPGGGADRDLIVRLAIVLSRASPFGKSGSERWCSTDIPYVSVAGIKDESPETVSKAVNQGLEALLAEGLAAASERGYYSRAPSDPLAVRIRKAALGGATDTELLSRIFILPVSQEHRSVALNRLDARLQALAHLGWASPVKAEHGNRFRDGRLRYRIHQEPRSTTIRRPARDHQILAQLREGLLSLVPGDYGGAGQLAGSLVIYKHDGYKLVDARLLNEVREVIDTITGEVELHATPARAEYVGSLASVYNTYVDLASMALENAVEVVKHLKQQLINLEFEANSARKPLLDLLSDSPGEGLSRLLSVVTSTLNGIVREAEGAVWEAVRDALARGDRIARDPKRFLERYKRHLNYTDCITTAKKGRGRQEPPQHKYSPHLHELINASQRIDSVLERRLQEIRELAEAVAAFERAARRLGRRKGEALASAALSNLERGMSLRDALAFTAHRAEEEASAVEKKLRARERLGEELNALKSDAERLREKISLVEGEARKLRRAFDASGVEEAGRRVAEAFRELEKARALLGDALAGIVRLDEEFKRGACDEPKPCIDHAGKLRGALAEAGRRLERASILVEEGWRAIREWAEKEVERARGELEAAKASLGAMAGVRVEAARLIYRLSDAERLLGEADPEADPLAAREKAARASAIISEVVGEAFSDERLRRLYEEFKALRKRGMRLGELLERLRGTGYTGQELLDALEALEGMAASLGYDITIRAEPRRRQP